MSILPSAEILLIGTGLAPLVAAAKLIHEGRSVVLLNPDSSFFLEESELPLDVLFFENANSDISKRFGDNLPENVYRVLSHDFPGAIEVWRGMNSPEFVDLQAPWIRARKRLWVARRGTDAIDRFESLYLRAMDAGWKPQWLEGLSLAKRFPGFDGRDADDWVGFLGPALADVDVGRYRLALLSYIRERVGKMNVQTSVHLQSITERGIQIQCEKSSPQILKPKRVAIFWTPKIMRFLEGAFMAKFPEISKDLQKAVKIQYWEHWELLSRKQLDPGIVAQWDRIRVWSEGVGAPTNWNKLSVLRRSKSNDLCNADSMREMEQLCFGFLNWDRFSVRSMRPRIFYRWNSIREITGEVDQMKVSVVGGCDGPIHWIASQVRSSVENWG